MVRVDHDQIVAHALLNLGKKRGILLQICLRILTALTDLLAVISEPRTALINNIAVYGKIENVSDVGTINSANGRNDSDIRSKVAVYSYGDKDKTTVADLAKSRKLVISW